MAKAGRKARERLDRRILAFEESQNRKRMGNFKPNATGPKHEYHKPGSMNPKKQSPKKRKGA